VSVRGSRCVDGPDRMAEALPKMATDKHTAMYGMFTAV
jgi:hypothetical protein